MADHFSNSRIYFHPACHQRILRSCLILIITSLFYFIPNLLFAQSDTEPAQIDREYIFELNDRISDLVEENKLDSARVLIGQALHYSNILGDLESEAYSMLSKARLFEDTGRPDSVLHILNDNLDRYENTEKETRLGNLLATANQRVGNYNRSLEIYTQMLALAEEQNDSLMIMGITQNLGNVYSSLGDMPAAMDSYLRSLEMAEEVDDTLVTAIVLDNLASVNVNEENFDLAEEYLFRAVEMNQSINNQRNLVTNYMSLGGLYKDWGRFDEAEEYYQRVLDLSEELNITITHIQGLYNLGLLFTEMDEYEQAMDMFMQSLQLSRDNNIHIGNYFNQVGMANVHTERGEYETAIPLYEAALEIAEQSGGIDMVRANLQFLQNAHESSGDTAAAYGYLKRYSEITDSLSRTEREEALARQETVLGLRAERENRELLEQSLQDQKTISRITYTSLFIILLALAGLFILYRKQKKAYKLLQQKTEELTEVNNVKDQLLSVLSHDLRTPLSSLKGVVFLIREGVFEEKDIKAALNEIDYQLQQGINTLSNYLQWAQNQRDGITANNQEISIKPYIDDAVKEIEKSALSKNVLLDNRVQDHIMVLADEQLLRVVLRNLLSNSIKYVDSGDKIIVDVHDKTDSVELMIKDTGMGIPEGEKEDLFKPFTKIKQGTKGEKGTGLGLSITKDFCEKMDGTIRFESSSGEGTTFIVTLKKPDPFLN